MTELQRIKNLSVPEGNIDAVLDTDAFNEIDDQFAIAYLLRCKEKVNVKALYAAPFFNENSSGPKDGMERSYEEIIKLLDFMKESVPVFRGSEEYLRDEKTPVRSEAVDDLILRAREYSVDKPLYVVAIGAITNIASALITAPDIAERIVIVWLGGHAHHFANTREFNMMQDVAAARVVFKSGAPLVQLPCYGVVSSFTVSKPELEYWLLGKGELADYLARNTVSAAEKYASGKPWTRVIWDVTAAAWLMNDRNRFMYSRLIHTPIPTYDDLYSSLPDSHMMSYVYHIRRDALMEDLINRIIEK